MKNLQLDLGIEEYQIGNATVAINPTDVYFVEKMSTVFDKMDGLQAKYKGQLETAKDGVEAFNICKNIDREMRRIIDQLFDKEGISDQIFGNISLFSIASNSLPVWANLLLALMDETDAAVVQAKAESNPKLEQYLKKYQNK